MKTKFLALIILIFWGSGLAYAGDYTDSAHGNSVAGATVGYGVNRSSTSQYEEGHCGHCHEQHASVAGTEPTPTGGSPSKFCLFADNFNTGATPGSYTQSDNFCFYCHCDSADTPLQSGITNKSYSITFGGDTTTSTPDDIMEAFNLASYHNLKDVIDWASNAIYGWPDTFSATDSNPCCACHNPHLAKRNKANPGNPAYTAISKPSVHDELWGDDDTERMEDYPNIYLSPYYYAVTPTNYEPANDTTSNGSNLPNYAAFCLDCHVNAVEKGAGTLSAIDWSTAGDRHGQNTAGTVDFKDPYVDASASIYALSCTDCHEPHGSSNEWLLRTEVNAKSNISITSSGVWYEFCSACHNIDFTSSKHDNQDVTETSNCRSSSCHEHGASKF